MLNVDSSSGTSASCVVIQNGKLYYVYVGDSKIVLCYVVSLPKTYSWCTQELTTNHKPDRPSETRRIEKVGGTIMDCGVGNNRVCCRNVSQSEIQYYTCLNLSRALGDFWSFVEETKVYAVCPEADVECLKLDVNLCKGVILATDEVLTVCKSFTAVYLSKGSQIITLKSLETTNNRI